MTEAVIRKLRILQGHGVITPTHCIRAERYVERHPEILGGEANLTVNQATRLAVESVIDALQSQADSRMKLGSDLGRSLLYDAAARAGGAGDLLNAHALRHRDSRRERDKSCPRFN